MAKGAYIGVDGVAKKIKKGYVGVPTAEGIVGRILPNGYTQVEYIESTGQQYIDTGVIGSLPVSVSLKMRTGSGMSSTDTVMIGMYQADAMCIPIYLFNGTWYVSVGSTGKGSPGGYLSDNTDYEVESTLTPTGYSVTVNGTTVINGSATSSGGTNILYLFARNDFSTATRLASARLYCCKLYQNNVLVRDFVPCKNNSGTAGLYDMVNGVFYTNAGTGTFVVGSDVVSVARKIKKAYIGIGNVARPCWAGGELVYYGEITPLDTARYDCFGASLNNEYALVIGGYYSGFLSSIEVYDSALTKVASPTIAAGTAVTWAGRTSLGNKVLIAGGFSSSSTYSNVRSRVDVFDDTLTRQYVDKALTQARGYCSGATAGNYAVFVGGSFPSNDTSVNTDAYDTNLTKCAVPSSPVRLSGSASGTLNGNAIFFGGYNNNACSYDSNLTVTQLATTPVSSNQQQVMYYNAVTNSHVISPYSVSHVVTYDSNLTRIIVQGVDTLRSGAAASVEGFAIFAGGYRDASIYDYQYSYSYDDSLVLTKHTEKISRYQLAGTSVGNHAIFAGGNYQWDDISYGQAPSVYTYSVV